MHIKALKQQVLFNMTIYVLVYHINQYDQQDEGYFLDCWIEKPTQKQLVDAGVAPDKVAHVLNGGGRIEFEDIWWELLKKEQM